MVERKKNSNWLWLWVAALLISPQTVAYNRLEMGVFCSEDIAASCGNDPSRVFKRAHNKSKASLTRNRGAQVDTADAIVEALRTGFVKYSLEAETVSDQFYKSIINGRGDSPGLYFDGVTLFRSFFSNSYYTIVSSATQCLSQNSKAWIGIRIRGRSDKSPTPSSAQDANESFAHVVQTGPSGIQFNQSFDLVNFNSDTTVYNYSAPVGTTCDTNTERFSLSGSSTFTELGTNTNVFWGNSKSGLLIGEGTNPNILLLLEQASIGASYFSGLVGNKFSGFSFYQSGPKTSAFKTLLITPTGTGATFQIENLSNMGDASSVSDAGIVSLNIAAPLAPGLFTGTYTLNAETGNALCAFGELDGKNLMACSTQLPSGPSTPLHLLGVMTGKASVQVHAPALVGVPGVETCGDITISNATKATSVTVQLPLGAYLGPNAFDGQNGRCSGSLETGVPMEGLGECSLPICSLLGGTLGLEFSYNEDATTVGRELASVVFEEPAAPVISASSDIASGIFPLYVNFSALGITGNISSWVFDFGDGYQTTFYNGSNSYLFYNPGDYVVTVRGIDTYGRESNTISIPISVQGSSGCTDYIACNFDSSAYYDDGTCDYSCQYVYGCMDSMACNYDTSANMDSGTCDYSCRYGCTDSIACNWDWTAYYDNGTCDYSCLYVYGCLDSTACNYNASANMDDGTCEYMSCSYIYGCTNSSAMNYNPSANMDDGSCQIYGCTNSIASNYNSSANYDDGSCQVYGCTNSMASNYNSSANYDDGSCQVVVGGTPIINGVTTTNDGLYGYYKRVKFVGTNLDAVTTLRVQGPYIDWTRSVTDSFWDDWAWTTVSACYLISSTELECDFVRVYSSDQGSFTFTLANAAGETASYTLSIGARIDSITHSGTTLTLTGQDLFSNSYGSRVHFNKGSAPYYTFYATSYGYNYDDGYYIEKSVCTSNSAGTEMTCNYALPEGTYYNFYYENYYYSYASYSGSVTVIPDPVDADGDGFFINVSSNVDCDDTSTAIGPGNCNPGACTTYAWRNGHYYCFKNESKKFSEARYSAPAVSQFPLGGYLVTITSQEEQDLVWNLIKNHTSDAWIGLTDFESEGTWKWVTGETFSYSAWGSGQPDNCTGCGDPSGEHFIHFYNGTNSRWNDIPAWAPSQYVPNGMAAVYEYGDFTDQTPNPNCATDNDGDGDCADVDPNDSNARVRKPVPVDADGDGHYSDVDCDDTSPLFTTDCSGNVVLFLEFETLTDSSARNLSVSSSGNATLSTAQAKFGTSSAYFDGSSGSAIQVAFDNALAVGSGDVVIDFWMRPTDVTSGYLGLFGQEDFNFMALQFNESCAGAPQKLSFWMDNNGSSPWDLGGGCGKLSASTFNKDTWYHIALVKSGTTIKLFKNGVEEWSETFSGALNTNSSAPLYIGRSQLSNRVFKGFIDNFRITRGTPARWLANFTPPTCADMGKVDMDGDGQCSDYDCNDGQALAYTGASEVNGDGIDNNCNGFTDESTAPVITNVVVAPNGWMKKVTIDGSNLEFATTLRVHNSWFDFTRSVQSGGWDDYWWMDYGPCTYSSNQITCDFIRMESYYTGDFTFTLSNEAGESSSMAVNIGPRIDSVSYSGTTLTARGKELFMNSWARMELLNNSTYYILYASSTGYSYDYSYYNTYIERSVCTSNAAGTEVTCNFALPAGTYSNIYFSDNGYMSTASYSGSFTIDSSNYDCTTALQAGWIADSDGDGFANSSSYGCTLDCDDAFNDSSNMCQYTCSYAISSGRDFDRDGDGLSANGLYGCGYDCDDDFYDPSNMCMYTCSHAISRGWDYDRDGDGLSAYGSYGCGYDCDDDFSDTSNMCQYTCSHSLSRGWEVDADGDGFSNIGTYCQLDCGDSYPDPTNMCAPLPAPVISSMITDRNGLYGYWRRVKFIGSNMDAVSTLRVQGQYIDWTRSTTNSFWDDWAYTTVSACNLISSTELECDFVRLYGYDQGSFTFTLANVAGETTSYTMTLGARIESIAQSGTTLTVTGQELFASYGSRIYFTDGGSTYYYFFDTSNGYNYEGTYCYYGCYTYIERSVCSTNSAGTVMTCNYALPEGIYSNFYYEDYYSMSYASYSGSVTVIPVPVDADGDGYYSDADCDDSSSLFAWDCSNNVVLHLHMNGSNGSTTFTDSSPFAHNLTASGNATISSTQSKFGGASGYFNSNGQLQAPISNAFDFATNDFSIQAWIKPTQLNSHARIVGIGNGAMGGSVYTGWTLYLENDGRLMFYRYDSTNTETSLYSNSTVTVNQWTHVAVTRNGGTLRFWINGVEAGSHTINLSFSRVNNDNLQIGHVYTGLGDTWFNGFIDELIIKKFAPNPIVPSTCTDMGEMDQDSDGVCALADCNDSNASVSPNTSETPGDSIDNNCNGEVDEYVWSYKGGSLGCASQGGAGSENFLGEAFGSTNYGPNTHGGDCMSWCQNQFPGQVMCASMYATWYYDGGHCSCYSSNTYYSWPGWGDREVWVANDGQLGN